MLSNLYLHLLDRIWDRHKLERGLGARLVRYADDLVVLCARDVGGPMDVLDEVLTRMDLHLNVAKTQVVDAWKTSFDFLGFAIHMRRSHRSGRRYPHVEPSKRSVRRIKERTTQLTGRTLTQVSLPELMDQLNRSLQGWSGYFHYRKCSTVFNRVKWHAEERLRTHLRKRHKIKSRPSGYLRFPSKQLYTRFGLYKLSTTAGWAKAHAL